MGATRRNLQAQPKMLKKNLEHQNNQSEQIFSQKKYVYSLKVKKSQKFVWGCPTEFADPTQNPKKLSEHQIYQSKRKFSQKKYVYFLKKYLFTIVNRK
jgi:hypothetical protein